MPTAAPAWCAQESWAAAGFLAFLATHEIRVSDLLGGGAGDTQRFFRVKRGVDEADVVARVTRCLALEGAADARPMPVSWLRGFYALPAAAPLARVAAYRDGQLFGIDASSGFAVTLLGAQPGDHVLDLCCAPGAKLAMLADVLELRGSVTGVDFSRQRLGACKQLVHKYELVQGADATAGTRDNAEAQNHLNKLQQEQVTSPSWRCRLFHADGRSFAVGPRSECDAHDGVETVLDTAEILARGVRGLQRKRANKSARARESRKQRRLLDERRDSTISPAEKSNDDDLYDKVLVDAECTHDGSIRHLQKNDSLDKWTHYVERHLNASEIERILSLQHALIRNGFRLLRDGGVMVYSTCSLSVKQNEEIVAAFLKEQPRAVLEPIDRDGVPCEEGRLPGTIRFTPARNASGLFIAKIRKVAA